MISALRSHKLQLSCRQLLRVKKFVTKMTIVHRKMRASFPAGVTMPARRTASAASVRDIVLKSWIRRSSNDSPLAALAVAFTLALPPVEPRRMGLAVGDLPPLEVDLFDIPGFCPRAVGPANRFCQSKRRRPSPSALPYNGESGLPRALPPMDPA